MKHVELRVEISRYIVVASLRLPERDISREHELQREKESMNASSVKGLILGLEHITEPVELDIITSPGYLTIGLNALEKWQQDNYIKPDGTAVRHKELWMKAAELLEQHKWKIIQEKKKPEPSMQKE